MLSIFFIALLGITTASSQASYSGDSFTYWGCGSVDPNGFGAPIQFPAGQLTPDVCKSICAGHMFAAVSPDACRCGDDPYAIISLDEKKCDNPCTKDPNSPMCGGICPEERPNVSNVFVMDPGSVPGREPVSASSVIGEPPAPAETASPTLTNIGETSTMESTSFAGQQPVTTITITTVPAIPAPPSSSPSSSEVLASSSSDPPTPPSQSSSNPASTILPVPPVIQSSTSSADATAVSSASSSLTPTIPGSNPPAQTWQVPNIPQDTQTAPSSSTVVSGGTIISQPPSGNTWRPDPSETINPGDPPLPSQITVSGSTQINVRYINAFWEALFLAAIIA